MKVSLATFCRCRPKHIIFATFTSKNTCLCQRHQNFALKLQALRSKGVIHKTNPDDFIRLYDEKAVENMINKIQDEKISFDQWKRVMVDEKKQKMKIVTEEIPRLEFKKIMLDEL